MERYSRVFYEEFVLIILPARPLGGDGAVVDTNGFVAAFLEPTAGPVAREATELDHSYPVPPPSPPTNSEDLENQSVEIRGGVSNRPSIPVINDQSKIKDFLQSHCSSATPVVETRREGPFFFRTLCVVLMGLENHQGVKRHSLSFFFLASLLAFD
ncbi:hypothetical protein TNIN_105861 [Trichonephila inaurata madagascariensis]|uniref:Uncharacterized protein n=1 Tax=Trichonephila inaurata madagascariensis TaxID=2747483 RepID=A0A8X7CCL7_9ARAC|nr:hypothetical protein TNIN_105861 [Trichonephila inaurata madagascariensis]